MVINGSGALLTPFVDPHLPIIYLTGKAEGIHIIEYDEGSFTFNSFPKMEKHFVFTFNQIGIDMLPKKYCIKTKCEIARFLSLRYLYLTSTEKTIDMSSVYVPRTKGEIVVQKDLYPDLPVIQAGSEDWFTTEAPLLLEESHMSALPTHKIEASFDSETSKSTRDREIPRSSFSKTRNSNVAIPLVKEGYLEFESRGWFSVEWMKKFVWLRGNILYILSGELHSLVPLASFVSIKNVKPNMVPIDGISQDVGFEFESNNTIFKVKTTSQKDRDDWLQLFFDCVKMNAPSPPFNTLSLPVLPRQPSLNSTTLRFMSNVEYATTSGNSTIWLTRKLMIESDLMVHLYLNGSNIKVDLAVESIPSAWIKSAKLVQDSKLIGFTLQTNKRAYHYLTDNVALANDWISQIHDANPSLSDTQSFETSLALIINKKNTKTIALAKVWSSEVGDQIHYYANQFSSIPLLTLQAKDIIYDHIITEDVEISKVPHLSCTLKQIDGSEFIHTFGTFDLFQHWIANIKKFRKMNWNLLERVGLNPKITLKDAKQLSENWHGIYRHTEEKILDSSEMLMIKISSASGTISHVRSVTPTFDSLTCDSSFVLDVGHSIFHWSGKNAAKFAELRV